MSPKVVFFALFCAASCLVSAQSVNLSFPEDGDRQIWAAGTAPTQPPDDSTGVRTEKSEANLPVSGAKDSDTVYVWDRKSGNLASKSVKDAKSGIWTLKAEDFKEIAQVSVHLDHDGKPVAAATVDLDDGKHKYSQLVDPSTFGTVNFFEVKPGSLTVTVHYKVKGKDATPLKQIVDMSLERPVALPAVTISLPDEVETVGAHNAKGPPAGVVPPDTQNASSAGPTASSAPEGEKKSSSSGGGAGSIFGSLIVYLIALGAMIGGIYYAMMYVKRNPDSVGSKLEQLGVQIPKPGDDPLTNPSQIPAPVKSTPAPVQKIILDDAAPAPLAAAPAPSVGFVSNPRLVSQTGDSMPIPEGEFSVGRELGLGLSLVGETTVSRKHANLVRAGGQVTVIDLGSTNGTFVNGVQLQGEKQLQSGDTVQFGSVRFRFEG
ncbi:MAG: FHA domain-containing protein [Fimbriimonas sp.]|nr:FHA domain-containing protein [Fimbriimonas sp.]